VLGVSSSERVILIIFSAIGLFSTFWTLRSFSILISHSNVSSAKSIVQVRVILRELGDTTVTFSIFAVSAQNAVIASIDNMLMQNIFVFVFIIVRLRINETIILNHSFKIMSNIL
jgi:hypothetical protein